MTRRIAASQPENVHQANRAWVYVFAFALGLLALVPRVTGLADFATTDEVYHWIGRTERFVYALANRQWSDTHQTGHPGVTVMWLGSLGLWLERTAVANGWASVNNAVEHLSWLRLPAAVLQSALVPAAYLLLRRLVRPNTALLAGLLWATAPYLIAHSRLLHLDALLTSFVTFSLLLMLLACADPQRIAWRPLIGSAACMGLALLTKGPALIALPFMGLLLFVLLPGLDPNEPWSRQVLVRLWRSVRLYVAWLGIALLVVIALWPALWVSAGHALHSYTDEILSNGGRPNGDGQFFLGQAVGDPGPLFYPVVNLFRMTPATLFGLLATSLLLWRAVRVWRGKTGANEPNGSAEAPHEARNLWALLAFVAFWTLVMTLGPKKFDRYVLPTWPAIEILAAAGLAALGRLLARGVARFAPTLTGWLRPSGIVAVALIGALLASNLAFFHPYYLSYYNPLLGGGPAAERNLLIGWGEGMDQVGAWLAEQPDIGYGPVLSALGATLQPFVPVLVRDVDDFGRMPANYAVVYLESVQREANPQLYAQLQQTVPLHTVRIHGIDYATIYQLPRPFTHPLDFEWADALRLRGVSIEQDGQQVVVTPAWDVRAPLQQDVMVFVRLLDANGQRVAGIDVVPGGADYPPTSAWQPGRQIAVPLPMALPADLPPGEYRLVLGLYDMASGARLPITQGVAADAALDGPEVALLTMLRLP
jgi:hypothetical protein